MLSQFYGPKSKEAQQDFKHTQKLRTTICENRTVCKDSNIHHTSVTLKILKLFSKINILYRKIVQNISEPFDVPLKNVKSRTTAKVSVLHRTNQQAL